jgi:hypothetical protein
MPHVENSVDIYQILLAIKTCKENYFIDLKLYYESSKLRSTFKEKPQLAPGLLNVRED